MGVGIISAARRRGSSVIDGTQGSANAGILAAVYFTVSGTTVTVVGQKNVATVTRNATGRYRVAFSSALANNNYGMLSSGRYVDGSTDRCALVAPDRDSTSGWNTYTTAQVDIDFTTVDSATRTDPLSCCLVFFDPSAVGSDYLAAVSWTMSGTTPTLQRQTNVASIPRVSAGVHTANFSSALASSDYSMFGSSRYPTFTNQAAALFGFNRNSTGPANRKTTALADLCCGKLQSATGNFDIDRGGMLIRNSDVAPRGTLAAVRFSVSGGVATIIRQWNVASVTCNATGCYRIAYTTPLVDADYGAICNGQWSPAAGNNDAPLIGINSNSSASRNVKSTTAVDIVSKGWAGSAFDCDYVDVWIVKPWLM